MGGHTVGGNQFIQKKSEFDVTTVFMFRMEYSFLNNVKI